MKFVIFSILISLFIVGCITTPEEKENQKNKEIVSSAIREGKPKPIISPTTAVISDTVRKQR